jgi:hypothetical protein
MKTYVNLLSPKHQRAALVTKLLWRWCAVWALGLTIVAVVFWVNKERFQKAAASISAAELACRPVVMTAEENARMLSQVRRFDCRETLVGQLGDERPVLGLLAVVSRSARVCDERVVVRDLHFEQQAENPSTTSPADQPASTNLRSAEPEAVLTISGDALDNLAIAKFAAALRDTRIFRDVELKSSVGKASRELPIHSFIVRCEI